jgi:RNA polymerase sigma-70 factor (ECF subfamily)
MPSACDTSRVVSTNTGSFAREWVQSQHAIFSFLVSLVSDFHTAEELLQETASQMFSQMDSYDSSRPFLPWAFGFARRIVFEHHRRSQRDRLIIDTAVATRLAKAFEDVSPQRDSLHRALSECREKLTARSKFVCRLRYEHDLLPQEIARRLGMTSEAVRTALRRIRQELRGCITRQLAAEGRRP